jgi:hypothetical protein
MEERYAAATARIVVFLRSQGVWLLVEPDSPVTPIEVSLRLTPTGEGKRKRLDSIVIGEQELLDEAASPDRSLNTFLGTQGASLQELLKLLAMEFTVPFSLLRANYNLSTPLEWNDSAGLSVMRTDQKSILTNLQLSFIDENTEEANG